MPPSVSAKEGRRWEDALAADLGGRRIFLSGAGFTKADVRRGALFAVVDGAVTQRAQLALRIEAKATQYESYTLRCIDWYDLIRAAERAGEHPVFAIRFYRSGEALAVCRRGLAQELQALPKDDTAVPVHKSKKVRPSEHSVLRLVYPAHVITPRRPDVVCVVPYPLFLERLLEHDRTG